jgi:hypothetical protein
MLNLVAPRTFLGWYKVLMLQKYLCDSERRRRLEVDGVAWLVWIDADAVVISHETCILSVLARAEGRELVIGEDTSPCCLVNSGVLAVRVCDWSAALWSETWECRKYFDVKFYEQSALIKCLKKRREGLELVSPFHSHVVGGPQADKLFPHVCVLHMSAFNSNVDEDGAFGSAEFIFHAVGKSKLSMLTGTLARHKLLGEDVPQPTSFRLVRGKSGGPPSAWALQQSLLQERESGET